MQRLLVSISFLLAIFASALLPRPVRAEAPPRAQAVLAQEARWLAAIVAGDRATVDAILSSDPEFTHITAAGKLVYRSEELATTKKLPVRMSATEQTVDFVGDVAIVHGLNTVTRGNTVLERVRFTDVFADRNGHWQAISAQESPISGGSQS
jgi:hypothetical protein